MATEHKEDLSRMEGTYGAEVIGKLKKMSVFIKGLTGLGAETAKNLILTGPQTVVLCDDTKTSIADLGTNFYLKEEHVKEGVSRGKATINSFGELNPNVSVKLHEGPIDDALLSQFNVVVFCDNEKLEDLIKWNTFCRSNGIVFLAGSILGMYASIFADYGDDFTVKDTDGEPLKTLIVDDISCEKNGVVTIDGDRHLLANGDWVKFEEVKGMDEGKTSSKERFELEDKVECINNKVFVVKGTKKPNQFLIGDTTGLSEYKSGGIINQVKVPVVLKHKSFSDNLTEPTYEPGYFDFTKMTRAGHLHCARVAVLKFQSSGALPALHSTADADEVVKLAKAHAAEIKLDEPLDETLVRQVALFARSETCAMASLFGGILAQEVTKFTAKYTPISQWLHFDAMECLEPEAKVPADATPKGTRYDHQIALFGNQFQEDFMKKNVFIVGCGALGCEYVKAVAMSGLGVRGTVSTTDDDTVDLSNLSRQFLFRRKHVTKSKSASSHEAALEMNPELKASMQPYTIRVEPKTEDTFNDAFWNKLDFVINALDNNHARKYTDGQCVLFQKPLFESGTLGTKANTAICIPKLTPSYSEGVVAGEGQGIAKCTLRNFPSLPLHCIEWAREIFDDMFVLGADNVNGFLEDKEGYFKKLEQSPLEERENLESAAKWIAYCQKATFEQFCHIMVNSFTAMFRDKIKDLQHNFPADARNFRTTEEGEKIDLGPFWHGHKRFPNAAEYDANNDLHLDYVYHGANILASVFGLKEESRDTVKKITSVFKAEPWVYSGAKVDLDEDKKEGKAEVKEPTVSDEDSEVIAKLRAQLQGTDVSGVKKLNAADFEKDDDENHHIDFLTAATNLRSFNYQIKESTRASVRMVAGRIIPAIATTTACITGFVQLEILKHCAKRGLEAHRAATINLAVNQFMIENLPDPIKKKSGFDNKVYMEVKAYPEGWTTWDTIDIKLPGCTVGEFLEHFKEVHFGVTLEYMSTTDLKMVYSSENEPEAVEALKKRKLLEVFEEVNGGPVHPAGRTWIIFDIGGEDDDGNIANVPRVRWHFQ